MRSMNDAEIIKSLGGPTAVARLIGLETPSGSRRVHNWIRRGIPAEIKVKHPQIFLVTPNRQRLSSKPRKTAAPVAEIATATAGQGA
jgi:hypothetical protein